MLLSNIQWMGSTYDVPEGLLPADVLQSERPFALPYAQHHHYLECNPRTISR